MEDEAHALFTCDANANLRALREDWWESEEMRAARDKWLVQVPNVRERLRILMRLPKLHNKMGRYIYQVLRIFDGTPMYEPPSALFTNS